MKVKFLNFFYNLMLPLRANIVFFVFIYLLGIVNSFIETFSLGFNLTFFIFFSQFFDVYLLCSLIMAIPSRFRSFVCWIISFFLYVLSIINVFCVYKFKAKFGPEILNLIAETNPKEANEFFVNFVGFDLIFSSVSLIIALMILNIIAYNYHNVIKEWLSQNTLFINTNNSSLIRWFFPISLVICSALCFNSRLKLIGLLFAPDISTVDVFVDNKAINTPINNLIFAIKMRQLSSKGLEQLIKTQKNVKIDSCCYLSDNMILIIGESYIRGHSQLYGYKKETTPSQMARTQKSTEGMIVPFTDVISPSNLTSIVFKNVLSLHSVDDSSDWSSFPLFPVLFRKANYKVFFITNQYVRSLNTDVFNYSGGVFLNDDQLSNMQFDYRNDMSHRYDEGLLSDFDSLQQYNHMHNLFIFHLAGQHFEFYKRSPDKFKVFKAEDYRDRVDLSKEEKQIVADYDNATYYNDYVVDEIIKRFEDKDAIAIYMPDHGEECYDELHRMGRLPSGHYSAEMARQEYCIPFWIWCSRDYISSHPDIFNLIRNSKDLPFMTDDLPHLLLFLAGIKTSYYDEERNILSDKFNINRERLIDGKINYDRLVE